jgi:UDP-N-acetylmuramoyl-L-alanyl-D-glutamate--2,6-diaminopimelate ligase
MKLSQLLQNIPGCLINGSAEVLITGISANSKLIKPGNLFIAKKGQAFDGTQFIHEAIERGASAILTDKFEATTKDITQIIYADVAEIESKLAVEYYRNPSDELLMIGMTGTNGKTTTSFILKYLLNAFKGPCGLIGTIEYIVGDKSYPASRTTPDVISNHRLLREMLHYESHSAVMEVTSHALKQGRVDQIDFDVAIFTNLTWDHLDYHETMENYCEAKNQLFRELGAHVRHKKSPKWAVVNQDSPWMAQIIKGCTASIFTYGIDHPADLWASEIKLSSNRTQVLLHHQGKIIPCSWPLVGRFNVYNCLAAIGTLLTQGFSLESIIEKMSQMPSVRGRLEAVKNALDLKIYVDYAHTDDALENVLSTLSELKTGKIITVFGCGGDRDTAKRPKMAKACEKYADLSIVTSDNPRSENPDIICRAIIEGFTSKGSYIVEPDRKAAIRKAILMAEQEDLILIAGKGHETYQIFAHQTIDFDDCQVAAEICTEIAQS